VDIGRTHRDLAPLFAGFVLLLNLLLGVPGLAAFLIEINDRFGANIAFPCSIKLLTVMRSEAPFFDFDDYQQLVDAVMSIDKRTHLIVLLGGDAGLRVGEIVALQWTDVDFARGHICVRHSHCRGQLTTPKSGRVRFVNMTARLAVSLRQHRHLRNKRVLCKDDGSPLTRQGAWSRVRYAARRAKLRTGVHILVVIRSARIWS
jgi:integrase